MNVTMELLKEIQELIFHIRKEYCSLPTCPKSRYVIEGVKQDKECDLHRRSREVINQINSLISDKLQ